MILNKPKFRSKFDCDFTLHLEFLNDESKGQKFADHDRGAVERHR